MGKAFFILETLIVASGFFAASPSHAQVSRASDVKSSRSFIYHGKIIRPDSTSPTGSMSVTLKILSPDPKLCVLWSEAQTVEVKDGGFSVELGHGVHRLPGASGGAAADFKQAFVNNPGLTISGAQCASGNSYTPSASDDRLLTATFNDAGSVIEIVGLPIKSVPFALQAEEIGGYGLSNLAKISGTGSAVTFTPAEVSTLKDLLGGDVFFDMKSRAVKNVAAPTSALDAANKAYVDTAVAGAVLAAGTGTVTSVAVGGLPLSVTSASTTPTVSIAQATASSAGYLSAADWSAFNSKQPAGAYLTSITSANVTGALGFTPLNQTLAQDQVFVGNASNVAIAGYFGLAGLRNTSGLQQFPSACGAHQTMTWSAITDVLSCTNINNLNADKITAGVVATARLGSGTADATKYLRGDGSWQTLPSGADNLGNHTATQNLNLGTNKLVGNGGTEGITIDSSGNVGVGSVSPTARVHVLSTGGTNTASLFASATGSGLNYFDLQNMNTTDTSGSIIRLITTDVADTGTAVVDIVKYNSGGFYLNNSDTNVAAHTALGVGGSERLRITSSGSVGIGLSVPTEKLDVAGKVKGTELCIGTDCRSSWPASGGGGAVQSVSVGGLPLSVVNSSTTPTVSITQANTTTAGYLSAADWNTFNGKLSSITSGNVVTALGFTPLSQTLGANQVFIGNGSNVATASFFGIEQMRNASGVAQFPGACSASQTLTWSAITDVLSCTDINNLNADKITAGTIATARLGSGTANATTYLRGDGTWASVGSGAVTALDDVGDVSVASVAAGQVLGWSGSAWVPVSVTIAPEQLPQGLGTVVGNATENSGLAAAFDGVSSQAEAAGAYRSAADGWAGKQYASNQAVNAWKAWGSTDWGLHNGSANGAAVFALQYKDSACTVDTGWTTADSVTISNNTEAIDRKFTNSTGHLCWRVKLASGGGGGHTRYAEIQFFSGGSVVNQAQWDGTSGNVYRNTGNVGIGTSSPAYPLQVAGIIHSTSGGIKFPDGSVLTTAPTGGATFSLVSNTGTNIGNMTLNGGVAAAFDGNTSKADATSAYGSAGPGYVGKDFGAGVTHAIARWEVWGTTDYCYNNAIGNGAATVALQYSNDNSTWGTADSFTSQSGCQGQDYRDRAVLARSAHRYWRVAITGSGAMRLAQARFYIGSSGSSSVWSANGSAATYTTGNVGIGTTSPAATLDVAGTIRPGSAGITTGGACSQEGAFAYDTAAHAPVYCNGSGVWASMSSGGSSAATAKAWVNFNGTAAGCPSGVCTIRSAYNVASVTRSATGTYVIAFTTALSNANYSVNASTRPDSATNYATTAVRLFATDCTNSANVAPTTGGFTIHTCVQSVNSAYDVEYGMIQVFGN